MRKPVVMTGLFRLGVVVLFRRLGILVSEVDAGGSVQRFYD
jgi:hypothetical protein